MNSDQFQQRLKELERKIIRTFNLKQRIILKEDCYFVLREQQGKGHPIYSYKKRIFLLYSRIYEEAPLKEKVETQIYNFTQRWGDSFSLII